MTEDSVSTARYLLGSCGVDLVSNTEPEPASDLLRHVNEQAQTCKTITRPCDEGTSLEEALQVYAEFHILVQSSAV